MLLYVADIFLLFVVVIVFLCVFIAVVILVVVLVVVVGLMLSGDFIIERHSVCACANLMETIELNARLIEERGVAPLVALASNNDPNSRGEVVVVVNVVVFDVFFILIYCLS